MTSVTNTFLARAPGDGGTILYLSRPRGPAPKRRRDAWAACFLGAREEPNTFTSTVFEGGGHREGMGRGAVQVC